MTSITPFFKAASKHIAPWAVPPVTKVVGSKQIRALSGSSPNRSPTLLQDQNGFGFARSNPRQGKPRSIGVTEIRGPYYSVMGKRYLADVLETMGDHVDGLKFAGGSFSLFHEKPLRELIDLAHNHSVYVSTSGWAEHLTHPDPNALFDQYLSKCKDLGFDVIELSSGFLSIPEDDWFRLVDKVQSYKLEPKPELGIQFGAGGDTPASVLEAIGTSDPGNLVNLGRKFLDGGQVTHDRVRGHHRECQFVANRCSLEDYERNSSRMCNV